MGEVGDRGTVKVKVQGSVRASVEGPAISSEYSCVLF